MMVYAFLLSFINAGNNFLTETQTTETDGKSLISLTMAYNGKRHQMLKFDRDSVLDLQNKPMFPDNPYGNLHPLLASFTWAFSENDSVDLDTLKQPDFWSKLRDNTVEIHREEKNGYPCIAWTFTSGSGSTAKEKKVFFAENMNFLPVYSEVWDNERRLRVRCSITKIEKVMVEGMEIPFPFNVEGITYYGPEAKLESSCRSVINPETLRINEPIDPDIFTIPYSRADFVFDRDLGVWLQTPRVTFGTSTAELFSDRGNVPITTDTKKKNVSKPQEKVSNKNEELAKEVDKGNLPTPNRLQFVGFILLLLFCLSIVAFIVLNRRKK